MHTVLLHLHCLILYEFIPASKKEADVTARPKISYSGFFAER